MWMSDDQEDTAKMSATIGRAGIEENRQDYPRPMTTKGRPMTTRGRPVTTKGRPMTMRGRRIQHGSVESLESRTSSEQTGEESKDITRSNNDNKEDRRLLNRSRAHTAPPSKYHSSCSLSSASSDSLNGSNNSSTRCKSMQVYPSPDNICRVSNKKPGYYEFLRLYSAYTKPLWKEPKLPLAFQDSKKLNHSSLTDGERFYLWRTASVYGMTDMKKQNQKRYEKILRHTVETGFHTEEEIQKYMNYFKGSRKRQFHTDPSVWREPPRIPVRQLRFRPPPTSPRGWNSYLPQGNLGRGRGQSTNSMSPGDEKSGSTEKSERQGRKKRAPGVSLEEEELEKDEGDQVKHGNYDDKTTEDNHTGNKSQQNNEDSPAERHDSDEREHNDEQDDDEQEQPPVQIYYDMKLKRTVIKPGAPDSKRDENEKNSSNNKRMKPKDNKVSFNLNYKSKEQNKLKGQDKSQESKSKGNLKSPRQKQTDKRSPRPPPPRRSWEKNNTDTSARPKTSRGQSNRVQIEKQLEKNIRADDDEDAGDGRRQSSASSSSRGSSSGTSRSSSSTGSSSSTSTSESSSSGSSSRSSSSSSRSDSAVSRSESAISRGDSAISKSESAISRSSSGRNSSRSGTAIKIEGNTHNNKSAPVPIISFREASALSDIDDEPLRPKVASAVGNRVIDGDDDESRMALAQSFWDTNKGQANQESNKEETAGISSPGQTDTSAGSSGSSSSDTAIKVESNMDNNTLAPVPKVTFRESSILSDNERLSPRVASAVGNRVIEDDDDESRMALAQSFWARNKGQVNQESNEEPPSISSPGPTDTSVGSSDSSSSSTSSSSTSSSSNSSSSSSGTSSSSDTRSGSSSSGATIKEESIDHDNKKLAPEQKVSFKEESVLSDDGPDVRPQVTSPVDNKVIEGNNDESKAAPQYSFWDTLNNKDQVNQKSNEETASSISSPGRTSTGRTSTSVGSSYNSSSRTSSSSGSSSSGSSGSDSDSSSSGRSSSVIGQEKD